MTSKSEMQRVAVLETVNRGGENGVTVWDIALATGVSGYYLSHALWGLLKRGQIRMEWQMVKGRGKRYAILANEGPYRD